MAKLPQIYNPGDPDVRASAQALKRLFLESAAPLVQQYIAAALGTGQLESTNSTAREEVWDVLKQMMLQASDKLDIKIETAEDVLEAVSSGKCTFEEGEKLLNLYKKLKEINTTVLPTGDGKTGGLTINILQGTEQPSKVIEHQPAEEPISSSKIATVTPITLDVPMEEYEDVSR